MLDMMGMALLFEMMRKEGMRRREFESRQTAPPARSRLIALLRFFQPSRTTKGPE